MQRFPCISLRTFTTIVTKIQENYFSSWQWICMALHIYWWLIFIGNIFLLICSRDSLLINSVEVAGFVWHSGVSLKHGKAHSSNNTVIFCILIQISLNFLLIYKESIWQSEKVLVMAWHWLITNDKPLPEPMMTQFTGPAYMHVSAGLNELTHCGLVMPYGVGDLGQHWFR